MAESRIRFHPHADRAARSVEGRTQAAHGRTDELRTARCLDLRDQLVQLATDGLRVLSGRLSRLPEFPRECRCSPTEPQEGGNPNLSRGRGELLECRHGIDYLHRDVPTF